MNLQKLFNPKSIAVVGASEEDGKVGNVIARNILELGYAGEVFLVNPKYDSLFGRKCYGKLSDVEKEVDLAIVAIPAKFVNEEIKNNARKIKNYAVISAGFSEIGEEGKEKERELLKIAEENNLNVLGPNCLGFIVPKIKLNASFAGGLPEAGGISFVSQSGALAVALMDAAEKEGMKFSNIISIGNKMQLAESELLEYLTEDENTRVIGMYLEGIRDGKKFMEIAEKISKIKPVIILKAGKNSKTQHAIMSHTGALAGNNEIISAVFEKTGVLHARDLEDFFNLLNLIQAAEVPIGEKSIVITNAGGAGVLVSDAFSGKRIQLADIQDEIKKELRSFLPEESSVENPIDLLGDAREDRYGKVLETVSKTAEIGSIICVLTPQDQTPVEKITQEIIKFKKETGKFIVTIFLGGERIENAVAKLRENGICNFSFPESAVSAIDEYFRWSENKNFKTKGAAQVINEKRKAKALEIIEAARGGNRTALYFSESAKIMEMYQVNTVFSLDILPENFTVAGSPSGLKDSKVKFPAVLKVDSDKVLHKTEKQGLILDIKNEKQLQEAVSKMKASFPGSRLIVQPMALKGTELIIGIKRDDTFGPVVVCGLGGIYTEIFKMADYLIPPLNISQIEGFLTKGKLKFLFEGVRGQRKYNSSELARIILGISFLSLEITEISEFDINPLIIYNDGKKEAVAVDVKIVI